MNTPRPWEWCPPGHPWLWAGKKPAKPASLRTSNHGGSCLTASSLLSPALGVSGGHDPILQRDTEPGAFRPHKEGDCLWERPVARWLCWGVVPSSMEVSPPWRCPVTFPLASSSRSAGGHAAGPPGSLPGAVQKVSAQPGVVAPPATHSARGCCPCGGSTGGCRSPVGHQSPVPGLSCPAMEDLALKSNPLQSLSFPGAPSRMATPLGSSTDIELPDNSIINSNEAVQPLTACLMI